MLCWFFLFFTLQSACFQSTINNLSSLSTLQYVIAIEALTVFFTDESAWWCWLANHYFKGKPQNNQKSHHFASTQIFALTKIFLIDISLMLLEHILFSLFFFAY